MVKPLYFVPPELFQTLLMAPTWLEHKAMSDEASWQQCAESLSSPRQEALNAANRAIGSLLMLKQLLRMFRHECVSNFHQRVSRSLLSSVWAQAHRCLFQTGSCMCGRSGLQMRTVEDRRREWKVSRGTSLSLQLHPSRLAADTIRCV